MKSSTIISFTIGFGVCYLLFAGLNLFHAIRISSPVTAEEVQKSAFINTNLQDSKTDNDSDPHVQAENTLLNKQNEETYIKENDMCSMLGLHLKSPSYIWNQNIQMVFKSSRHLQDKESEYIWHDYTARLLNYMTTQRMQISVKNLPFRYWYQVDRILKLLYERIKYIQENGDKDKDNAPRKVNILVMGGSVTMGVFCNQNPVMVTSRFARRNCAWPTRLEMFLNSVARNALGVEGDIVSVHMITLGGTNTESAIKIWDYDLFPADMPFPDIVFHGYATNDMHVLSVQEAEKRGITLEDMILEVNQQFVRAILKPRASCEDNLEPLLIYYDDYIGNEQRELVNTHSFARAAQTLASYYGFGLISYADAVRHLVYADTKEDFFSPSGWPDRQVHPSMSMHISSTWIIAYNLLNMAATFCSSNGINNESSHSINKANDLKTKLEYKNKYGLPKLRSDNNLAGEPDAVPSSMLPELTPSLSLDDISSKWQDSSKLSFDSSKCSVNEGRREKPCTFSWIGGLERKFDKVAHLEKRMKPVLVKNDGWRATADNNKLGYETSRMGATFEILLKPRNLDVKTLNFMVMKSYGEKWKDSKVRIEAYVDRSGESPSHTPAKTLEISGIHDRHTSETYNHFLDLGSAKATSQDSLRIKFVLVGGNTFKFMGMAFCNH